MAVRQTGPSSLHLIGTAATPLGGDSITVRVVVEAGATLHLETVAATIALPSRERLDSRMDWWLEVGAGARLYVDPEPTIVAAGAEHRTDTKVIAAPDATVIVAEYAQLGRGTETQEHAARARWQGGLHVDVAGAPVLRHRLALEGLRGVGHRAVGSVFRYPDERAADVSPTAYATRLELARPAGVAGSTLTTAVTGSATAARAVCDELDLVPLAL